MHGMKEIELVAQNPNNSSNYFLSVLWYWVRGHEKNSVTTYVNESQQNSNNLI